MISAGTVETFKKNIGGTEEVEEGPSYGLVSAGPKADSGQLWIGRSR